MFPTQMKDQEPECLREEANPSDAYMSCHDQDPLDDGKRRVADDCDNECGVNNQRFEEEISPPCVSTMGWSVGDKVVAYWNEDSKWKVGVIMKLFNNEAEITCVEDSSIQPAVVNLTRLKPVGMPVDALNTIEVAVGNINKHEVFNNSTSSTNLNLTTITPSLLLRVSSEDICTFAKIDAGSKYLQSLVCSGNKKLCEKMTVAVLACGPVSTMTNPVSSFLVQKLVGFIYILPRPLQYDLIAVIINSFSQLSLHKHGHRVVQAAIVHLGPQQRQSMLLELENKATLLCLIQSSYGSLVVQECVPHLHIRTVTSMASSLLGHVILISSCRSGSHFIQKFLARWGVSSIVDLLVEDILQHVHLLVHDHYGSYVIQALLQSRADSCNVSYVAHWIIANMEEVYKEKTAVRITNFVLPLVAWKVRERQVNCPWKEILTQFAGKLLTSEQKGRPLFIRAACDPHGHLLIEVLLKQIRKMEREVRDMMVEMVMTYRTGLAADKFGCLVLKNVQGLV